jgi:hypothetical protein
LASRAIACGAGRAPGGTRGTGDGITEALYEFVTGRQPTDAFDISTLQRQPNPHSPIALQDFYNPDAVPLLNKPAPAIPAGARQNVVMTCSIVRVDQVLWIKHA